MATDTKERSQRLRELYEAREEYDRMRDEGAMSIGDWLKSCQVIADEIERVWKLWTC